METIGGKYVFKDGKLLWEPSKPYKRKTKERTCPKCKSKYLSSQPYCQPCLNMQRKTKRAENNMKPQSHKAAYTHVLRDAYSLELYKFSILQTPDLPKGYDVVYKINMGGMMLPKKYSELESYHEVKEILDSSKG